jgi:hypothetical protein
MSYARHTILKLKNSSINSQHISSLFTGCWTRPISTSMTLVTNWELICQWSQIISPFYLSSWSNQNSMKSFPSVKAPSRNCLPARRTKNKWQNPRSECSHNCFHSWRVLTRTKTWTSSCQWPRLDRFKKTKFTHRQIWESDCKTLRFKFVWFLLLINSNFWSKILSLRRNSVQNASISSRGPSQPKLLSASNLNLRNHFYQELFKTRLSLSSKLRV